MQQTNYEIRVGLFALFALILLVWGWAWLKSFSFFHPPQRFVVRFHDVAGLSNNATVNVQGVRVGAVEYIAFTPEQEVDVHLKITDETLSIPENSTITIQTLGMVGAKYIEITLPEGTKDRQPIPQGTIVKGADPVRVELVVNNIASKMNKVFGHLNENSATQALNNLNEATAKLNKNMDRFAKASDSVEAASRNIGSTAEKFGHTAETAQTATEKASTFFKDGDVTLKTITTLAGEFRGTNSKVSKLLDNPNFSGDLKETLRQARITAETISATMKDLSATLQDRPLREELLAIMTRLQQSTQNIKTSMEIVNKIASDEGLRRDLKDAVKTAKDALEKADNMFKDPQFKTDLKETMAKVRAAAGNVDIAAQQIHAVLGKRAPLLHLIFGRPGAILLQTQPGAAPVAGAR